MFLLLFFLFLMKAKKWARVDTVLSRTDENYLIKRDHRIGRLRGKVTCENVLYYLAVVHGSLSQRRRL